jgi:hypothetical protein
MTPDPPATSFIVAPHRASQRGETLNPGRIRQGNVDSRITGNDGAIWLRENNTGRLTFVRPCPVCGAKHKPSNNDKQEV